MKRAVFEYIPAWVLLVIFGLIVLHAPLSVWLGVQFPDWSLGIKAWKELLMVVPLVLIAVHLTLTRQWRILTRDKLFWLIMAYAVVHVVSIMVHPHIPPLAIVAGLGIDLRYILYFSLVYAFLRCYPAYRTSFVRVGIAGALIVSSFTLMQLALPRDSLKHIGYGEATILPYMTVDKNPDYIRHNSTLRGPNSLGAYTVIAIGLVSAYIVRLRRGGLADRRAALILLAIALGSLVGVWVSYSRSALVAAAVAVVIVVIVSFYRFLSFKHWVAIVASLAIVATFFVTMFSDTSFFKNVVLHDDPETGASRSSNQEHADSLVHGAGAMFDQPFGDGIGSSGSASLYGSEPLIIENQYFMVAHEVGWVGLALFAAIFGLVLWRLWQRRDCWLNLGVFASGVGLALIGILLPVWMDDTVSIVWWGLAAVALSERRGGHGPASNQKTTRTT